VDDEEDYSMAIWAGVVPVQAQLGVPVADDRMLPGVPVVEIGRVTTISCKS